MAPKLESPVEGTVEGTQTRIQAVASRRGLISERDGAVWGVSRVGRGKGQGRR